MGNIKALSYVVQLKCKTIPISSCLPPVLYLIIHIVNHYCHHLSDYVKFQLFPVLLQGKLSLFCNYHQVC